MSCLALMSPEELREIYTMFTRKYGDDLFVSGTMRNETLHQELLKHLRYHWVTISSNYNNAISIYSQESITDPSLSMEKVELTC